MSRHDAQWNTLFQDITLWTKIFSYAFHKFSIFPPVVIVDLLFEGGRERCRDVSILHAKIIVLMTIYAHAQMYDSIVTNCKLVLGVQVSL